jgi:membrane associated rhomboid family serine protease
MVSTQSFEKLCEGLDRPTAEVYSLVLTAKNIVHRSFIDTAGWVILVKKHELSSAREQIKTYLKENPEERYNSNFITSLPDRNYSMLWIAMVLTAIHLAAGAGIEKKILIEHLGALSEGILNGELFRCATALTLHNNIAHLSSNLAGLLLFGTVLCQRVGTGSGWILILFGGSCGNFLNALFYQAGHLSIGASTAVFSTLGSLSAFAMQKKQQTTNQKLNVFLPIGGGMALLAFLGGNPQTDILAHLFGFGMGFFLAAFWGWGFSKKLSNKNQWALSGLSFGLMAACWFFGLYI